MLRREHFERMRDGAVFINTGRGRTVREDDLCDVLAARPDLTALLDVTYPEPPKPGSRLFTLPNALLSTHIAGSIHSEVARLGEIACAEFLSWKRQTHALRHLPGKALDHGVRAGRRANSH